MITPLQTKLLNMLKWFHDYCVKHEITYYALGGTLLGAVRHKGFIPWDDDIDIGLPRRDYEKLIACMSKEELGQYVLETPGEKKDNVSLYCKIFDTTTTRVWNGRRKIRRGIFLDIFPLDGIGNTPKEARKNYKKILFRINLHLSRACALKKGRPFYKNAAIVVGHLIPETVKMRKRRVNKINRVCASRSFDEYKYAGNLLGAWKYREIVERTWFGEPTLYPFEDMEIYGPENAHAYLTGVYGDYMQLPPEEKRVSSHDYLLLDLEKSYLDS